MVQLYELQVFPCCLIYVNTLCKYVGVYDKALLETLSYYKKVQDGRLIDMCSKNRIVHSVGHLQNDLDCSPSKDLFFKFHSSSALFCFSDLQLVIMVVAILSDCMSIS